MRDANNIREVESLGIDLMGFICWQKSKRAVTDTPAYLPTKCRKVGVFVNPNLDEVLLWHQRIHFQYIQLHGDESPQFCSLLKEETGCKIIKAISVSDSTDIEKTHLYEAVADLFLFDTKCEGVGGCGQRFNWNILEEYHGRVPFLLAGGISMENLEEIKHLTHPMLQGIDLNSRFETEPGHKNSVALKTFLKAFKESEEAYECVGLRPI